MSAGQGNRLTVVVPYGRAGSSARVRAFDWLDHTGTPARVHDYLGLAANSPSAVLARPVRASRAELGLWRLSRQLRHETVLLVREASPFSRGRVEQAILAGAGRSVYDFDDALGVDMPGIVNTAFSKSAKWRRCVRAADTVIAGNEILAEAAEEQGATDIRIIPSCVEPSDYRRKTRFGRSGPPVAVWMGSPATEPYLAGIAESLLKVHAETGLRLVVISAGDASLGPLDRMVDRRRWSAASNSELAEFDFGVMPLPDDPWSRGKCAYKLLQYGAAGLPMIGSPVGANVGALDAMGGTQATTAQQWTEALMSIATLEEPAAQTLGARARQGVEQYYSFSSWRSSWLSAVRGTGGVV